MRALEFVLRSEEQYRSLQATVPDRATAGSGCAYSSAATEHVSRAGTGVRTRSRNRDLLFYSSGAVSSRSGFPFCNFVISVCQIQMYPNLSSITNKFTMRGHVWVGDSVQAEMSIKARLGFARQLAAAWTACAGPRSRPVPTGGLGNHRSLSQTWCILRRVS